MIIILDLLDWKNYQLKELYTALQCTTDNFSLVKMLSSPIIHLHDAYRFRYSSTINFIAVQSLIAYLMHNKLHPFHHKLHLSLSLFSLTLFVYDLTPWKMSQSELGNYVHTKMLSVCVYMFLKRKGMSLSVFFFNICHYTMFGVGGHK